MIVDREWVQRNLGFDPIATPAPAGTFTIKEAAKPSSKVEDFQREIIEFDSETLACAAPGVGIVSTVPDKNGVTGGYMEMDGTSMASPAACGTLAVILSKDAAHKAMPRNASRTKTRRAAAGTAL